MNANDAYRICQPLSAIGASIGEPPDTGFSSRAAEANYAAELRERAIERIDADLDDPNNTTLTDIVGEATYGQERAILALWTARDAAELGNFMLAMLDAEREKWIRNAEDEA